MERTKFKIDNYQKEYDAVRKSYATLYNLSQHIPRCKQILESYSADILSPSFKEDWPELTQEMDSLFKETFNNWLAIEKQEIITKTLLPIRRTAKLKSFLLALQAITEPKYKFYLDSDYKAIPRDFAAPSPFLVLANNEDFPTYRKSIYLHYGEITLQINGLLLKAEDGQLLYALMTLMRDRIKQVNDDGIHFTTNVVEVAKAMQKSNPWSPGTQQAIKNGLIRLRGCVIILTNMKGNWSIGGILTKATKLDDDELRIVLDKDYIDMLNLGYVKLDPDVYLKLSPVEANLYKYLMRQQSFNTGRSLSKRKTRTIYEQAGLGGTHPADRSDYYIIKTLNKALEKLQARGELDQFSVDKKYITIWNDKGIVEKQKALPATVKRTKSAKTVKDEQVCLMGYTFFPDDEGDRCFQCDKNAECEMF